jgi:hypothetical protein
MYQINIAIPRRKIPDAAPMKTPYKPSAVLDNANAIKTRRMLNVIVVTEGGIVFPRPLNVPAQTPSMQLTI